MIVSTPDLIQRQLLERRGRLKNLAGREGTAYLAELLREVDSALERVEDGSYGLCDVCHEPVEDDRLLSNPLSRSCRSHLSTNQLRSLELDLRMASRIQARLLPERNVHVDGWEIQAHYEPAGAVSGDYYDIIPSGEGGETYFLFGDVSGKGVAASILMASLQAIFRSLVTGRTPLDDLMVRANRLFSENTLPTAYATLICGRVDSSGGVEMVNAGHLPPLLVQRDAVVTVPATGLPLGLFPEAHYEVKRAQAGPSDVLLLYTDGITEARNGERQEYGEERVASLLERERRSSAESLVRELLRDVGDFCNGAPQQDDLTLMALRRT